MSIKGWAEANRAKGGIIRYLFNKVKSLDAAVSTDTTDVTALKTTVGDSNSGLVKDTAALKTTVGDAGSGLVKDVAANKTAIGTEETEGSILYRIKALETAANTGSDGGSGET